MAAALTQIIQFCSHQHHKRESANQPPMSILKPTGTGYTSVGTSSISALISLHIVVLIVLILNEGELEPS
jgi:hypothetical protein